MRDPTPAARPLRGLKRLRKRLKYPVLSAVARAWTLGLDRRPRGVGDLGGFSPRSIVAVRIDRIGDLLCSTPLLAALHRRWPEARLVVIPGPKNRAVLAGLPFVEEGPVFGRDPASAAAVAWWLTRQRFDLCVSLRAESMAGAYVATWSRAPVRMITHAEHTSPAFNLILGVDDWHQTTRYCHAALLLGAPCAAVRPVFVVPEAAERRAAEFAAAWTATGAGPLVGIQLPNRAGRRHASRAWPRERVATLARALASDGCKLVLCGTGAERAEAERLRAEIPGTDLAPAVPLAVFAAIQRRFALFISPYSGTLHLADAVGTPTVAYGQPEQVSGWSPIGERHRHVEGRTAAEIPVDAVLEAARELLAMAHR
jgi:ADP-heptose:LPS heptosyltransferase